MYRQKKRGLGLIPEEDQHFQGQWKRRASKWRAFSKNYINLPVKEVAKQRKCVITKLREENISGRKKTLV